MVNVRFSNYEQFLKFFRNAPRNIQNILYKAYPDFAARMTNDYINATKKIAETATKVKDTASSVAQGISGSAPKQISMAKDTVKGTGKVAEEAVKNTAKSVGTLGKIGGKLGTIARGGARLATRVAAPIQGAINVFSPNSDTTDKLSGVGMIGAGIGTIAGAPVAAPIAGGLLIGDLLKKEVAAPVGDLIGKKLYGTGDEYNIYKAGDLIDPYNPDLNIDAAGREKIDAYNRNIIAQQHQNLDQAIANNQAEQSEWDNIINRNPEAINQVNNDYFGGSYPSDPTANYGIISQNSQNGQEGGLNINRDNLYLNQFKPSLNSIVEPVNYSNLYQQRANEIINQLDQNANQGENRMASNNPYIQFDAGQFAQPTQQQMIDYNAMLNNFNQAMDRDARQNQVNALVNSLGALGTPDRKAPIYYVGANGDLRAIELDQPSQVQPLPTNISSNTDKFLGQLKIQQAQQAAQLAQQKQQQDILKQQREYIDMVNAANALGEATGYDPRVFMNTDYGKAVIEQMIHPEAQATANIRETVGKAPTQARLKQAEQLQAGANQLDNTALTQQYAMIIQQAKDNAEMARTMAKEAGLNNRAAAQIEAQAYLTSLIQSGEDTRNRDKLENDIYLQAMKNKSAENVANIYRSPQQKSESEQMINAWNILTGNGTPIPQAIKYMQVMFPNFGTTEAELNELNR
ncbi:MAG: hypothetical protein IIW92_02865 [Lachnospiraceae bacterium]|nr:hypothetical protein [Lachnospiraceae bacterium]